MDAGRSALDSFSRLLPRYEVAPDSGDDDPGDGYEPDDPSAGEAPALPIRYVGATAERGVDVDAVTEMVSVLDAQRAYEAKRIGVRYLRVTTPNPG